jgi:CHAT domain-containing protein
MNLTLKITLFIIYYHFFSTFWLFSQDISADTTLANKYRDLADKYSKADLLDSAVLYYEKSQPLYIKHLGVKSLQNANILYSMGIVYRNKNKFDLALNCIFKSLQIEIELLGEKNILVASSYGNIGNVYSIKNEYDLALEYYFKSLKIKKALLGENHKLLATDYNNIGISYKNKNEYDLALDYYFKSLQIKKELLGEKHIDVAKSYNNIGIVYNIKNEYDLALEYLNKSLQIKKEQLGEKHTLVATSYNNIGIVYYAKKEYDLALEYYIKSLEIRKALLGERNTLVARCYNNIGNVYSKKNENNLALEYLFKAIQIQKELQSNKNIELTTSYNDIGNVYQEKKEFDKALKFYQKGMVSCIVNFNDTANIYSVPAIANYLGWNYLLQNLQGKAQIFAQHGENLSVFKNPTNLQLLALRHYQACDTLINQVRSEISTQSDKLALGEKASQIYEEAIDVCLKLADCSDPQQDVSLQNGESVQQRANKYQQLAFYFSEKNKSSVLLEALAGQEAQKFAGIPDSLLKKEHDLKVDIAFYTKQLEEPENIDSIKAVLFQNILFRCNRSYDSLILVFEKQFPDYFSMKYSQKTATVEQISNLLDKKTVLISYFVGDSVITIFTVTKKSFNVRQIHTPPDFSESIAQYRNFLRFFDSEILHEKYKKYAYQLYELLFPKNFNNRIKNLIIIPDGALALIPFETMLTENPSNKDFKDLPYLCKKYNISYSYSATLFERTFPKETTQKVEITPLNDWLALAPVFPDTKQTGISLRTRSYLKNLNYLKTDTAITRSSKLSDNYIPPLPWTETEVINIFNQFKKHHSKADIQLFDKASESFVKSDTLRQYRFIHFATHAFVNSEKPELSGILLAKSNDTTQLSDFENLADFKRAESNDGILYSGEIFNMKFNADLMVLSACETGLGKMKKGEGIIGLTRALLYAGTKNIIVSLWPVADQSTSALMIDFYRNVINKGNRNPNYSNSLRKAKLKMIENGIFSHPFYWSPFILIGK